MAYNFVCSECGRVYDPGTLVWRCACGGLLDLADFPVSFPLDAIHARPATLWRYREALPFALTYEGWRDVTLGEGFTPLVPLDAHGPQILLKVDYLMPTLSFKDRGAAVLIAKAQELGVSRIVADSSGNAGTALAAYAARAGIACDVYVPASASAKKLKQIAAHGATVHAIAGSREDTANAAIAAVEREEVFYASHVYNPFFFQGTKTYAYEIWEQLDGQVPDVVILPVGNGTLLLGAYYGFKDLQKAGMIETIPRFLAIQAEGCAPLARAFERGEEIAASVVNTGTAAEGIAIAAPARSRQILAAVRVTKGTIITVTETAIEQARQEMAKQGWYIEPTAAVNYAGLVKYITQIQGEELDPMGPALHERIVLPLCGAGLKAV
jgi:threonine synthase